VGPFKYFRTEKPLPKASPYDTYLGTTPKSIAPCFTNFQIEPKMEYPVKKPAL
jgi:hypothetical protein